MRGFGSGVVGLFVVGLALAPGRAQSFNSVDTTHNLNYFNGRAMPPHAYRVLFIGDSLTFHGQTPNLWDYDSGMAASSPEKDFVHQVARHIQEKVPSRPVETLINNGGNGRIGTMLTYLTNHPDLKPSLVILQGGENDKFDPAFQETYRSLLSFYSASKVPYIVLGDWWDGTKSAFDHQEASAHGYAWVDLTVLDKNPAMSGDGGPYHIDGVAKHPNDAGMKAIAGAVDEQFDRTILPSVHGTH
jgi:lysophospholipase L1-like esterase